MADQSVKYYVAVSETIEVHERLSGKVKNARKTGKKKIRAEFVTGHDFIVRLGAGTNLTATLTTRMTVTGKRSWIP